MSRGYARGNHALGLCQRCGFQYRLSQLREDGDTALLVCSSCYDIEHPAETPIDASEAIVLRRPSPDVDADSSRVLDDDRPLGQVLGFDSYFGEQS